MDDGFARIERAILALARPAAAPPRMADLARGAGMRADRFSREFRRRAGLGPKRFWEVLAARRARAALGEEADVLSAALRAGLSGPGRLHDLTTAVYAMSPAELRDGGAGLVIRAGLHDTPLGPCLAAATSRGLCRLEFLGRAGPAAARRALAAEWPKATVVEAPEATRAAVHAAFGGGGHVPLHVRGTTFQIRVWEALLRIPPGATAAYAAVAAALGRPSASRAVGGAVGANPVALLIPCHRVIRATGALGGYRWGEARKAALLARESAT